MIVVNRSAIWRVLQLHDVERRLMEAVKNCDNTKSCVRVGREENGVFSVHLGLRHEYFILGIEELLVLYSVNKEDFQSEWSESNRKL